MKTWEFGPGELFLVVCALLLGCLVFIQVKSAECGDLCAGQPCMSECMTPCICVYHGDEDDAWGRCVGVQRD